MKYILSRTNILFYILILVTVVLLIYNSYIQMSGKYNILGFWEGDLNGKALMFEFKNDQTCILSFRDKKSGLAEMLYGNFDIDLSKEPIPLSIRNIPKLNHPLHTVVKFIRYDSIRLAMFSPSWKIRPISFESNTSMNLKRVKKI